MGGACIIVWMKKMRKISVKIVPENKKFPEELIAYFPFTVI
jgi:hypothetical protein